MTLEIDKDFYLEYSSSDIKTFGFDAEWLLADRLGGFASQTLIGSCARRYHSLFLINTSHGRINVLPQMEELIQKDTLIPLSTNVYQDVIYPEGYLRLVRVRVGPTIQYEYAIGESTLIKEIFKPQGKNKTYIRYRLLGDARCQLLQIPLFSGTSFHSLRKKTFDEIVSCKKGAHAIELKTLFTQAPLYLYHSSIDTPGFSIEDNQDWFYNFRLKKEEERGLDYQADFYSAIKLTAALSSKQEVIFAISDELDRGKTLDSFNNDYEEFSKQLKRKKTTSHKSLSLLSQNHDAFFIKTNRGAQGVVAGYHWFEEWGRDTFIALSFLTDEDICNDSFIYQDIFSIFKDFLTHSQNGILPNRFISNAEGDGHSGAEFNSVDSLLWAVVALYKIHKNFNDKNALKDIWISICTNIDSYIKGTDFGIYVHKENSLLYAGDPQTQLTWMDARVDGIPMTPRYGACVEINALFYNALRILEEMCVYYDDQIKASSYRDLSEKLLKRFREKFMLLDRGYLADRVYQNSFQQEEVDISFRPNQLFALSLPFPLLSMREGRLVLQKIEKELLTKFGLRTLSREDKDYRPVYQGGVYDRDSAYHQGTVWPWLLGAYVDAVIEYGENDFRPKLEDTLESLITHIRHDGIGYVSEVFGGDDDRSGGAIAQCWSGAAVRYCLSRLRT